MPVFPLTLGGAERRYETSWPSAVTDNNCISLSSLWGPRRDGRNRSGERPTSRADPGTVSRYLLPCVPPPYAVIPKDRQACAIWPHFGFPGHILGIQTMPPPRLSLPSALSLWVVSALPLHPCLSAGSSGRGLLS
ncbi:Delta-aminolevulinic acid dehydratase, partial [Dissostichus eleginoides]